jgi:hypothetical protein
MRGGYLITRTSSWNLASRLAGSLGVGESSFVGATAPAICGDVPCTGDGGGRGPAAVGEPTAH